MKREEWRRERYCTRKRAFATEFYAEATAVNDWRLDRDAVEVYECRFCGEFHIRELETSSNGKRQRH